MGLEKGTRRLARVVLKLMGCRKPEFSVFLYFRTLALFNGNDTIFCIFEL